MLVGGVLVGGVLVGSCYHYLQPGDAAHREPCCLCSQTSSCYGGTGRESVTCLGNPDSAS